jgi:cell division septum initiation protein DivIVA
LLFDISKTNANDAFHYWIKIIREILPASQIEEAEDNKQGYEKLQQKLTEYLLIVDSSEQRTARPVDYEEQKKLYSGKKKMHTLGLAEKKRKAYCTRVVGVLLGHKRQEKGVKLEIVVHR